MIEPLTVLLHQTIGIEQRLRALFDRPDIDAAAIHGSWAAGGRRPNSDVDVLVVGRANLRELRRAVRPLAKETGRMIDLTVLAPEEFRRLRAENSSVLRRVVQGPVSPLVGDLTRIA